MPAGLTAKFTAATRQQAHPALNSNMPSGPAVHGQRHDQPLTERHAFPGLTPEVPLERYADGVGIRREKPRGDVAYQLVDQVTGLAGAIHVRRDGE